MCFGVFWAAWNVLVWTRIRAGQFSVAHHNESAVIGPSPEIFFARSRASRNEWFAKIDSRAARLVICQRANAVITDSWAAGKIRLARSNMVRIACPGSATRSAL